MWQNEKKKQRMRERERTNDKKSLSIRTVWAHDNMCIRIFTCICFLTVGRSDGWLVDCCYCYCFYFVFAVVIIAIRSFDAVQKSKCALSDIQNTICQQCHSHCALLNSALFIFISLFLLCFFFCCSCCRYRLLSTLPIIFLCVFI